MNIEEIRTYCLTLKHTTECMPFDEDTLVFKVLDKMFCLLSLNGELAMNLKCQPDEAEELRDKYPFVISGRHMNKKHWNTVLLNEDISDSLLKSWITKSYDLVIAKMPQKDRQLFR